MKLSHRVALMLFFAVNCLTAPLAGAAPVDDFLGKAPVALKELAGSTLGNVLTPPGGPWSATAKLFGMDATIYLYWVSGSNTPIVVIPLPAQLTADKLFKVGKELDIGVSNPVLFWVPDGMTELARLKMPGNLPSRVQGIGLPDTVQVIPGFNLFGRVESGSFLDKLLTPLNLPPANLTAGLAKGKDGVYITSLLVTQLWDKPFGLADTSITGAVVKVTKDSKSKTVEAWGTALVKNKKNYTVYLKRDDLGTSQSLGFDTKSASLEDFFVIAGVVGKTLGLPAIPWPSQLPLNKVAVSNPSFDARHDPRTPPDFTKMMFQGTQDKEKKLAELNLNAAVNAFGWTVAKGYINATSSGVAGDMGLAENGKIGPIDVPSASLYLKVNSSEQAMGIKARTVVFGDLDLKASGQALKLVVSPSCPLRPVGFSADVSDIGSDFPIKPTLADCFSKGLEDLANGAEDAYKDTEQFVGTVATDAAATAEGLGKDAAKAAESLHLQRAAAWPGAIVTYAADIKSAKDAAKAAGDAVGAARHTVDTLIAKISHLDDAINDLAKDIKHLLEKLWGAITGEVKKKKHEKSEKVSLRDDARTQKAAADARLAHAKKNQAEKDQASSNLPGPDVSGNVAEFQEALLGAQAQALVQPELAAMMRDLPAQLKDGTKRKKILGAVDLQTDAKERAANYASNPPKISDLYKDGVDRGRDWLTDAKEDLISQAVTAYAGSATETLLQEKVATLPTMAYDMPVYASLVGKPGDPAMCIESLGDDKEISRPWYNLKACNQSLNQLLRFEKAGTLKIKAWGSSRWRVECFDAADGDDKSYQKRGAYCSTTAGNAPQSLFYYDAIEGLIRYLPPFGKTLLCVRVGDQNRIVGGPCPAPNEEGAGARWRLVDAAAAKPAATAVLVKSTSIVRPLGLSGRISQAQQTNLEPLRLK